MARRSNSRRRFARRRGDILWITTVFDNHDVPTGAVEYTDLVLPEEWERNASGGLERGATLMSIRGSFTTNIDVVEWTAAAPSSFGLAIAKVGKNDLFDDLEALDPLEPVRYGANDVVWSHAGFVYGHLDPNTLQYNFLQKDYQELNVKAKRKLDTSEKIILAANTDSGIEADTGVVITGIVRCLIKCG